MKSSRYGTGQCPICGVEFERRNEIHTYCSKDCYKVRAREIARETYRRDPRKREKRRARHLRNHPMVTKECAICGNPFTPYRSDSKYCSAYCKAVRDNRYSKYVKVDHPPRKCEECGTEYKPSVKHQKYCSKFCSGRASRRRNHDTMLAAAKRWRKENRERYLETESAYRERNREKLRERQRERYHKKKEQESC